MDEEKKGNPDNISSSITVLVAIVFVVLVANVLGYVYLWEWVGVVDIENSKIVGTKTLWDWMDLLIVPFVLAVGAYLFNRSEKLREGRIAEQQRENERKLASEQVKAERELSQDRQQQTTLELYFDRMTNLLLDKDLRDSEEDDEVRTIARIRTLTVLRGLNGDRRGQVLQFLYEAGLVSGEHPIIDMSNADLRGIDLSYANLENVNLSRANLRKADLHSSKLMRANFYLADLDEINLSWADLREANLQSGLRQADLGVATMDEARLFHANLAGANLINASLIGADLRHANFKYINEAMGDLEKDNILHANLALADLSHCNLTNAKLDDFQLTGARGLKGATMPNGEAFEEWLKKLKENEHHENQQQG